MRKQYRLALDTETTGTIDKPLAYDIGFAVVDNKGNIYDNYSFVNYDIYVKEREKMKSAYYAKKLPQYEVDLRNGSRTLATFYTIRKVMLATMKKYGIDTIVAYNTDFDRRALNNTFRYVTNGKFNYFFPKDTKFLDAWAMACNSVCKTPAYRKTAYENGWFSEKGNIRTTAETVYAFISGQDEFEEDHTALEDVMIEAVIMAYCWNKTTPAQREIVYNPWRIPQKEWYYTEHRKDIA